MRLGKEGINQKFTMNWGVGEPLARPCLMRAFVKTISVNLTVRSSSFEAPS